MPVSNSTNHIKVMCVCMYVCADVCDRENKERDLCRTGATGRTTATTTHICISSEKPRPAKTLHARDSAASEEIASRDSYLRRHLNASVTETAAIPTTTPRPRLSQKVCTYNFSISSRSAVPPSLTSSPSAVCPSICCAWVSHLRALASSSSASATLCFSAMYTSRSAARFFTSRGSSSTPSGASRSSKAGRSAIRLCRDSRVPSRAETLVYATTCIRTHDGGEPDPQMSHCSCTKAETTFIIFCVSSNSYSE